MTKVITAHSISDLEFSVVVKPSTVTVLNATSYNRFSIVCNASIPENVMATKSFVWRKGSSGIGTALTDSDEGINITTLNPDDAISISNLTTSEVTPGSYLYTCDVTVLSYPSSATANVIVNGMQENLLILLTPELQGCMALDKYACDLR